MIRFGTISSFDDSTGRARVKFDDDDTVSHVLNVIYPGTGTVKFMVSMTVGDHVAVLCGEDDVDSVIIGGFYPDSTTKPSVDSGGGIIKVGSSEIKYDSTGEVVIKNGTAEVQVTSAGVVVKNGAESLKQVISDLIDQINLITVPTSGGPSGVPINAAAFSAIKVRLQTLLG